MLMINEWLMEFIFIGVVLIFVAVQVILIAWNGELYFWLCFLACFRKYFTLPGTCMMA